MTIETAQAGNWVAETFTNVDDYLALGGTSGGYVRFRDAFRNGDTVFYSAVDDDNNREAGTATFQDGRLVDRNVTAVLRSGVYEEGEALTPVNFIGTNRIVSGTFNQYAFEKLWSHVYNEDNPHNNPFGVPEAPADGKQYSRKNKSWSEIVALGTGAIPDAPVDGKIYGRENALWKEVYIDTTEFDEIVQDVEDKIQELDDKIEEIENGTINSAELNVSGDAVIAGSLKAGSYEETLSSVSDATTVEPYRIGNASLIGNQAVGYSSTPNGCIFVSSDGLAFISSHGNQNTNVGSGINSTAHELSGSSSNQNSSWSAAQINAKAGISGSVLRNLWVSQDGTKVAWWQEYSPDSTTWGRPIIFETSVPWQITDANMTLLSKGGGTQVSSPSGLWFSEDGTRAWTARTTVFGVTEYYLSVPWNWNSAIYVTDTGGSFTQDQGVYSIYFSPDGLTFMVTGTDSTDGQCIYKFELTTAYDLSTATKTDTFSGTATATLVNAPHFYDSGKQMVLTGGSSGWDTYTITQSVTTADLDCSAANTFELTLDTSLVIGFDNVPASGTSYACSLTVKQDATGGHSITWPSSVVWAGGEAPTLTADASAEDVFVFMTSDNGTTWYGFTSGQAFA